MFLNQLSILEKEAFISLSVHAAEANGVFANEEFAMIEEYCKEMGISFFDARNIKNIEEVIEVYKNSSLKIKKIVLLETLGLLYADSSFDADEMKFLNDFANEIGLTKDEMQKQIDLINKYLEITTEIVKEIEKAV